MAALSTALAIASIATSVASVGSTLLAPRPKAPPTPTLLTDKDPAVTPEQVEAELSRKKKRGWVTPFGPNAGEGGRAAGRAGSLLTGPSGLGHDTTVSQRRTLLGGS